MSTSGTIKQVTEENSLVTPKVYRGVNKEGEEVVESSKQNDPSTKIENLYSTFTNK